MYIDSIEHMENYDPTVAYQVGDEIIDTYVVGDKHYLFLPSWGIVNGGVDTEDIIVMKSENLPSMHIWTDSGSIDEIWNDKEAFETGRMSIYDTQGEKLYSGEIKGVNTRGHYSFTNYEEYRTEETKGKIFGFIEDFDRIDFIGGYLIEHEFEDRYKIEYEDNPSSFVTAGGEHFLGRFAEVLFC